jgi:hypothetical protein
MGHLLEPNVKRKYAYFLEWTGMGNGTLMTRMKLICVDLKDCWAGRG